MTGAVLRRVECAGTDDLLGVRVAQDHLDPADAPGLVQHLGLGEVQQTVRQPEHLLERPGQETAVGLVGNDQGTLKLTGIGRVDPEVSRQLHWTPHTLWNVTE